MTVATAQPSEWTQVERPLIEQLATMGWASLRGDTDDPTVTERSNFRDVLIRKRLHGALRRINLGPDGSPWLDDSRINQAINALEHIAATKLMEANEEVTRRLIQGIQVEGLPGWDDGRDQTVRFIDWDDVNANDYLVINQFRVDPPGRDDFSVPDLVLFVNGIPLVVIECKSPAATNPMEEGITQLLRYSNQRDWFEEDEGVEKLFHYNQVLISTYGLEARAACVGAGYEHFLEWKDTSPVPSAVVAEELGGQPVRSQETLVAGMLRPGHLLDLVRNFTLFAQAGPRRIKLVARYQQFRAVHESIRRLAEKTGRDRGGIIWHTQGSGKSLTMVFLVRKMRTLPELRRFKVVAVTDRQDLEKQLFDTAQLTGEVVEKAGSSDELKALLSRPGAGLVFAMIQKYRERDVETDVLDLDRYRLERRVVYDRVPQYGTQQAAERGPGSGPTQSLTVGGEDEFPELNTSAEILVLVDEAHRSQSSTLHANLRRALPNAAMIGYTGTPILMGQAQRTHEIFGPFIDRYTIKQSEEDGSTVPILYEGRTAHAELTDGRSLDQLFEDLFRERTQEELEAIKRKYATTGSVLEAPRLIEAKARDMLRHYVDTVLPNGFKAQVVATSRLAAVRYQQSLMDSHRHLLERLDNLPAAILDLDPAQLEQQDDDTRFLVRAHRRLDAIRRLEFAVIISGSGNDDPAWREWTERGRQDYHIARFKKPLVHADPAKQDGLAFLCIRTMLLTGYDAPVEQVLYLDRSMRGHELLQAIARVNRTHTGKTCDLVVDYIGVGAHLKEALAVYAEADVEGAMKDIRDELPRLRDRHQRAVAVFLQRGVESIEDVTACVEILREVKVRAEFVVRLKLFLESLDIVLPRPEALPYVRDAKILGFINKAAANLYRDGQLNLMGAGRKVRQLIDEHVMAQGIDPRVPPISILDAEFEQAVDSHVSPRTKASEMEHAARYHIRKHWHEDPAYYKKLSERLEEIIQTFEDNWDRLVEALRAFTAEVREGRPADESGLDPKTQAPFLGLLLEEVEAAGEKPSPETLGRLAAVTVELVDHIRQEIRMVDFWRNQHAQDVLRMWVGRLLDDHDVVPFEKQRAVASRIMELAKARRESLLQ